MKFEKLWTKVLKNSFPSPCFNFCFTKMTLYEIWMRLFRLLFYCFHSGNQATPWSFGMRYLVTDGQLNVRSGFAVLWTFEESASHALFSQLRGDSVNGNWRQLLNDQLKQSGHESTLIVGRAAHKKTIFFCEDILFLLLSQAFKLVSCFSTIKAFLKSCVWRVRYV